MAYTEAQKQASKRWYDKHKEEIAVKRKPIRKKTNSLYYKTRNIPDNYEFKNPTLIYIINLNIDRLEKNGNLANQ